MRRPNGTGTIVRLSGNRRRPYVVRIASRDKYGAVIQKALSYHATAKEAQAALDAYNNAPGMAPAPDKLSMTVQDVYSAWSERKYARAGKASVASYTASWSRLTHLSHLKMRDLTVDHLQKIIDQDETMGLSKSSINNDKLLMRCLYAHAMERDIVSKDYSSFVKLPSVDVKHEKGAFTDLQIKRLEDMASSGTPWADTVLMLCYTGFRINEFLALTRFSYSESEHCLRGGLKTKAGRGRMVPVHPKIQPYLNSWLAKCGDFILCDELGRAIKYKTYRDNFAPLMQELGVPQASPHWCRHTFATKLYSAGVPELEQKRLLGHSDKDVTEHYTHTDLAQLTAAIRMMA